MNFNLALALFSTKRTRDQLHGAEVTADITNTVTAARVQKGQSTKCANWYHSINTTGQSPTLLVKTITRNFKWLLQFLKATTSVTLWPRDTVLRCIADKFSPFHIWYLLYVSVFVDVQTTKCHFSFCHISANATSCWLLRGLTFVTRKSSTWKTYIKESVMHRQQQHSPVIYWKA